MALNNLVKLVYIDTSGDEVDHYDTIYTTEAPLSTYLTEILKTIEWGYIDIYMEDIKMRVEYGGGKYKTYLPIISQLQDKIVYDASYTGGWGRGDWKLYIKEGH